MTRILFVCTGNICRSPTAEGVARHFIETGGLGARIEVDSAGTQGYHAGEAPDPRTQKIARQRGYDLSGLRARKLEMSDFQEFDLLLAMDRGHLEAMRRLCPPDLESWILGWGRRAEVLGTAIPASPMRWANTAGSGINQQKGHPFRGGLLAWMLRESYLCVSTCCSGSSTITGAGRGLRPRRAGGSTAPLPNCATLEGAVSILISPLSPCCVGNVIGALGARSGAASEATAAVVAAAS